ncbi:MAG: SpoIIE family protein phosphatase [Bacillota bacterium]
MKIKEIAKNLCFFVAFLILNYIESVLGIVAFSVAFFMALVYCKQNVLVLSPLYICAGVAVNFSIATLISVVAPIVAVVIAMFVHYRLRKKLRMLTMSICTVVSLIPTFIFNELASIYGAILGLICSQISLYCFVVVLFAVLKKRMRFSLSKEEVLAFCYTFAVFGMGFASICIVGYSIFSTVVVVVLLAMLFVSQKLELVLALSLGIGGAIGSGDISYIALSLLFGGVCAVFDRDNQYIAGVVMVGVNLGYILIFNAPIDFFTLIAPAVGVVIFFAIPNKFKDKLIYFAPCFAETELPRTLINRDRKHIADKLNKLSQVFYEISDILHIEVAVESAENDCCALTKEVVDKYCKICPNYIICQSEIGGADIGIMFQDVVHKALKNNIVTLLDTPPVLSSRCVRIGGLLYCINNTADNYKVSLQQRSNVDEGRAMISDQMEGVGILLDKLKSDVETNLTFDKGAEQELKHRLSSCNIAVKDTVIFNADSNTQLTLIINECDIVNPKLKDTINAVMGYNMDIISKESMPSGLCAVHLEKAAKFSIIYGASQVSHTEGVINGDNHSALKIDNTRAMLILADGMGSGKSAAQDSGYCVSMLEAFYKAGFDHNTIASSVGRLLAIRAKESFNAVDIAVIDTYNGHIDFVKLGGRESFIVCEGVVEVVECGSLPLGIIAESAPLITRSAIKHGSTIVMVSDGIVDYIGRTELTDLLSTISTINPEMVASTIIEAVVAINGGKTADDASVVVARIVSAM